MWFWKRTGRGVAAGRLRALRLESSERSRDWAAGQEMEENNQRRYTRVPVCTPVEIRFADEVIACETTDLCLSGAKIACGRNRRPGDRCAITFHRAGITGNRLLRLGGEVVRVDGDGMAVIFTDMNYRALTSLQAMLLDSADNPFDVAEEFLDSLPADQ